MKLPFNLFKKNNDEESEYYLALLLTDEKISAVILQQTLGQLRIVGKNEEFFASSLETVGLEELIDLVDKTVSKAEEILPPDIETHKTVFGVKNDWVESDTKKIKPDYLAKLKKVCDSLDLSPIGFMVITEAISNLLQDEEGAPLSAILAEVGKKIVTLTLFRGGKVAERIDGPLEENAAKTVDTLLKHFTTAVLPARIILYDAKESESLAQKFIGHQWSKSLPFLHVPQIMALPEGTDARAVVFGAALQMGFEVLGMETPPQHTAKIEKPQEDISKKEDLAEIDNDPQETNNDDEKTASVLTADNFGFVKDKDIIAIKPEVPSSIEHTSPVNLDQEPSFAEASHYTEASSDKSQDKQEESLNHQSALLTNAQNFLSRIRLPRFSLPTSNGNKRFILPIAVILGIIILGAFLTYYYTYKVTANIVLTVKPKIIAQTEDVTFSPTASNDFSKNIIATKIVDTSVTGDLTTDATGKKDVGNKAKGTVTLYNNGSSSVKLESGTTIKSSNNVLFLLDKDVTISSASGDIFSGTKPGTVDTSVTAKDIGTDSNLPSGTKFTIGSNANLAAKNDNAFSGGSKKQVQVVSKNDVEKLKTNLPKSLEGKANEEITKKVAADQTLIPLIIVDGLSSQKFDKDIDDEAKKVKLTASVKFEGQTYQKDDMTDFAKARLKNKYSQDISFADNTISTSIKDPIEKKSNQITATLVISAGLLPNINKDEIIKNAQNESLPKTQDRLSELPQVIGAKVNFSPNIPFLPHFVPHLPRKINIEVKPE